MEGFSIPLTMLAQITWDVSPVAFNLGSFAVRWYSLAWFLTFVVGAYLMWMQYRREGKTIEDLEICLLYLIPGAIIGARLGHCFFYRADYYLANPLEVIAIWKGFTGLASHGAAVGILIALYIFSRRHPDQPYVWILDRIAAPIALGAFLIRMGNLMNSEILGLPSDVPWAMVFVGVDTVPRHPGQLYEALAYLTIFLLLLFLYWSRGPKLPRGLLAGLFLVTVFSARFFIEFVKERHSAFEVGLPLSMGQILSIPIVAAGLVVIFETLRRQKSAQGESPG